MNVIYALTKDAILSLEKNSLISYLHTVKHPGVSPEQIEKMLNIYNVTIETFPLNQKAGTLIGRPDKQVETLSETTLKAPTMYYLVNPQLCS